MKKLVSIVVTSISFLIVLSANAQLLPPSASASVSKAAVGTSANNSIMEGLDYKTLASAQPTESKGKIEVTEFFWYACPHCYDLEPELQAWVKRQNKDVVFKCKKIVTNQMKNTFDRYGNQKPDNISAKEYIGKMNNKTPTFCHNYF